MMDLTHYRTLGQSGLRVSPLALGTMTFGEDWGWGSTPATAAQILAAYLEAGGNIIDTANVYTKGHAEKIIGDYIRQSAIRRDQLVISTKFFCNLYPGDPNGGGTGRKAIIASLENSLRRLQTDYIDIYWMHAFDPHTPIAETMSALHHLVTAGKVRYIAVSDTPAWKVAQAQLLALQHGWTPFIGLQLEYSLLERTAEGELIPMAQELGLGVMPWSPLKEGVLSGKYTRENSGQPQSGRNHLRIKPAFPEATYQLIDQLIAISHTKGCSPAAVALAWVISRPGVTSTLAGARTPEQLQQNLAALAITLTPEEIQSLEALSTPVLSFPIPFLRNGVGDLAQAGTTLNGVPATVPAILPTSEQGPY
ncbi:aldo/keto reductase [Chitinophaga nivalis]|uniref:Aldo/keto reductase n=1 Tax=Chitinophaga nivalis TaxID=2991709 RepID=A0ABT3IJD4_9BACT|nr:aldo/keto reductase [Chitinophaga nivalis]MCW3466246.1 aldo/keto reductase [Chitinophaga nivalis]MCW3484063.1 aldo/keto reductase [Chitinophaga nivalis]